MSFHLIRESIPRMNIKYGERNTINLKSIPRINIKHGRKDIKLD